METVLIVVGIAFGVAASLAVVFWVLWQRATRDERRLIKRITSLRFTSKLRLAALLATDRCIPFFVRAIPPLLVLYLAMPIDVIPDFIPVLGQLDDLFVVLVGAALLLRFAPRHVIESQVATLETDDEAAQTKRLIRRADGR